MRTQTRAGEADAVAAENVLDGTTTQGYNIELMFDRRGLLQAFDLRSLNLHCTNGADIGGRWSPNRTQTNVDYDEQHRGDTTHFTLHEFYEPAINGPQPGRFDLDYYMDATVTDGGKRVVGHIRGTQEWHDDRVKCSSGRLTFSAERPTGDGGPVAAT